MEVVFEEALMWTLLSDTLPDELRESLSSSIGDFISVRGVDADRHFDARSKTFFTASKRNSALLKEMLSVPGVREFYSSRLRQPVVQHAYPLVKAPGGPATTFHQDRAFWTKIDSPPSMFTLWFAITDVSPENGCLRMGSSVSDLEDHRNTGSTFELAKQPGASQDVPMRAGEILFFDSFQPHGAYPNSSSAHRFAVKVVLGELASMRSSYHPIEKLGSSRYMYKLAADRMGRGISRRFRALSGRA